MKKQPTFRDANTDFRREMTSGKICVVTRHQYGIFAPVLFRGKTSLAARNASCFTRLRSRRIKNYNNIFTFCGETSLPS